MSASKRETSKEDSWNELNLNDTALQQLLDDPQAAQDDAHLRTNEQHAGFDNNTADSWIYPSNLPCRAYQLSIAKTALYRNTLVVLPTGLGKTLIAAVIMYNFYRWYPTGKVIFMAPTRPLVAQQIEACQRIMPFPDEDTVELTGKLHRARRTELWHSKRVFFATPQVVQSDIVGDEAAQFPFDKVKLIVVDEAHKAKGRYAYTEVTQTIWRHNRYFRVLALSATPGRTMEDVAEVVRNLLISQLEVRSDASVDVMPYVHKRSMKTVVVGLSAEIKEAREELLLIIDPYIRQLIDAKVLSGSLRNINRNFLLYEQKRFREHCQRERHPQQSAISSNFSTCVSLYHALELLERHGMRVFLNNFDEDEEGRVKFIVNMDRRLRELLERLRSELGPNPFEVSAHAMTNGKIAEMPKDLDFGHPKFERARECLVKHFEEHPDSRAIVFCEYRESVMLVYRLLLQHAPLLKPRCFVGQGGSTGALRALTQKQQIQIMNDFRAGKSNILIATSIGEEGIDVGEVELIVCFDISTSNPTRFVQRIGRTGRQKNGHVVMLVTEGREQQLLQEVLANKDQTNKKILTSTVVQHALYKHAPRLVPTEFNPQCVHAFIKRPEKKQVLDKATTKAEKKSAKTTSRQKAAAPLKSSQDLRNYFKKPAATTTSSTEIDKVRNELGISDAPTQPPGPQTQLNTEASLNRVKDYFEQLDFAVIDQPASTQGPKQRDAKHLRRLNKFLKSSVSSQLATELSIGAQLQSKQLSDAAKLLLLRLNADFVRQALEQMQVLQALEIEEDAMTAQELEIRQTYDLIEKLFGGVAAAQSFLQDDEYQRYKQSCVDKQLQEEEMHDDSFEQLLPKIFDGLDEQGFCCDNFDYIQQQLAETVSYQQRCAKAPPTPPLQAESMIFNTMLDEKAQSSNNTDFSMVESKYSSQWKDFEQSALLPNRSTPLQTSALAKAFKRQEALDENKVKSRKVLLQSLSEEKKAAGEDDDDEVIFVSSFKDNRSVPSITKTGVNKTLKELKVDPPTPAKANKQPIVAKLSEAGKSNLLPAIASDEMDDFMATLNLPSPLKTPTKSIASIKCESTPTLPSASKNNVTAKAAEPSTQQLLNEMDIDLDVFLEPFPEELTLVTKKISPPKSKENTDSNNVQHTAPPLSRQSPVIFQLEANKTTPQNRVETVTRPQQKPSLASKLAAKCTTKNKLASTEPLRTPTKSPATTAAAKCNDKSPSIFDMYLKHMRGRGKLPTTSAQAAAKEMLPNISHTSANEDSPIVCRRKVAKRKIIESSDSADSDFEGVPSRGTVNKSALNADSETECEEIEASPQPKRSSLQQRKKRRRLNAFIEHECGVSGGEGSADEHEETIGQYLKDSVVVSSDEEDNISPTQMQMLYLQSIKSPPAQRGNFKIPAFRTFNDRAQIYSQAVPVDASQYVHDSFVVSESQQRKHDATADASMCPLERAEKILKERRREKRQFAKIGFVNSAKRRQVYSVEDSSEDERE